MTIHEAHKGLHPEIREAIRNSVLSAVPLWNSLPPTDLWRIERPTGAGGSEISLEPKRGVKAFIAMSRALASEPDFIAARDLVLKLQPELSGWIGSSQGGVALQFDSVVINLVAQLEKHAPDQPGKALEELLDELDNLLRTRRVRFSVLAPLQGVIIDSFTEVVVLGPSVVLRCLRDAEIEELCSNDVLAPTLAPRFGGLLVALEASFESSLFLRASEMNQGLQRDGIDAALRAIDSAQCVLHSFKPGAARIVFEAIRPHARALPGLGGSYLIPPSSMLAAAYPLEKRDIAELERFAKAYTDVQLPELKLAASRLRDSELRPSPRDAIVDAFVGIEALLNPFSDGELSFRLAMNYSTFGPVEERHARYRKLRDLYKVRNRIVHGAKEGDVHKVDGQTYPLYEISQMSKALLREVIKGFVDDQALRSLPALSAAFWEDRHFRTP
jgi:hypothetical protein